MCSLAHLTFRGMGLLFSMPGNAWAESGAEAWLRYAPLNPQTAKLYQNAPSKIVLAVIPWFCVPPGRNWRGACEQILGRRFGRGSVAQDAFLLGKLAGRANAGLGIKSDSGVGARMDSG